MPDHYPGQNYRAFLQDKIDCVRRDRDLHRHSAVPADLVRYKLSRGTRVVKYSEMEFRRWTK